MHAVTVRTPTGSTRSPAGVATTLWSDFFIPHARVATPGRQDQETSGDFAGYGQVDVVVRVPRDVVADENCLVVVANTGQLGYDGTYEVVGIRPNELDTRLMCRRRNR